MVTIVSELLYSGRPSELAQSAEIGEAELRLAQFEGEKTKVGKRVEELQQKEAKLEARVEELKRRHLTVVNRHALADKFKGNKVSALTLEIKFRFKSFRNFECEGMQVT